MYELHASEILTGTLPGGSQLKTRLKRAAEIGVAAGTLDSALQRLEAEGLIRTELAKKFVRSDAMLPIGVLAAARALVESAMTEGVSVRHAMLAVLGSALVEEPDGTDRWDLEEHGRHRDLD